MKKYLLIAFALVLTLTLTGCGENESSNNIPSRFQGLYQGDEYKGYSTGTKYFTHYYVYKVEENIVKAKICQIGGYLDVTKTINDCNFDDNEDGIYATSSYEVKEVEYMAGDKDGDIFFNLYNNGEKYAKCRTTFGKITCTVNNGDVLSLSKKD